MRLFCSVTAIILSFCWSSSQAEILPGDFHLYYVATEAIRPDKIPCGEMREIFYNQYQVVKLNKHSTNSFQFKCGPRMDGKYHYEFELLVEPKTEQDIEWVNQYAIDHRKIKINKQNLILAPVQSLDVSTVFWVWKFKLDEPGQPLDKYAHLDQDKAVHLKSYAHYRQLLEEVTEIMKLPTSKLATEQLAPLFPNPGTPNKFAAFVKKELPGMHSFSVNLRPVFSVSSKKQYQALNIEARGRSCLKEEGGPCTLD